MRQMYLASVAFAVAGMVLLGAAHVVTGDRAGVANTVLALFAAWASAYLGDAAEELGSKALRVGALAFLAWALVLCVVSVSMLA